jgi:phosphoadenosine phosphosulfate reductase
MNLIKDGKVVPINWQFIDAPEQLSADSNPVVSVEFLLNSNIEQLNELNLGVLVNSDDQLDDLIPHLSKIDLIVIEFSSFSDGRGFSTAYRLRNSIGYDAEIWARGKLIADQYSQALQCGIDAVLIDDLQLKRQPIEQWQKALDDAPIPYRFENHIGQPYHESKKKSFHLINANDNADDELVRLNSYFSDKPTKELLNFVLTGKKMGRVALVSSFGTQSSVLLHLVANIDSQVQVLFIDTGKLFPQTLQFQKELASVLNLTNTKSVRQNDTKLTGRDPDGNLWNSNNSACCDLRKVEPLKNELNRFDSWISGRKIFQGGMRSSLNLFEKSGDHIKVNPLANWSQDQIKAYIDRFSLPIHPLINEGYSSVGCMPCTSPAVENQSSREGRWSGIEKTECGIHLLNDISADKDIETQQQAG